MAYTTEQIRGFCELNWETWKRDCSGFVKAVAQNLGIILPGQANDIVDFLESSSAWENLGTDKSKAMSHATDGYFVVGGLKAAGHGHLVVVVDSHSSTGYPLAYWGRLSSNPQVFGKKNTTINWSWSQADLPNVRFYAIKQ